MSRYDIEYVTRDLEKVGGIAALELKFNLRNRTRRAGRENLPLIDRHDHIGAISIQMIGRALNPGLENRFQCFVHFVDENWAESRILYPGEIRFITLNRLLPLGALEVARAIIDGLDGLDALVALVAHPQGQSVIAQKPIIGIKIDGNQCFAGGIMKSARKMRMIPERNDIFGCHPKL